jgi:hypothetical protein
MLKVSYWHGVVVGVLATAVFLLWKTGVPPFYGEILAFLSVLLACGGIVGGGVVLAWRHVVRNPRILGPTAAILMILSLPSLTCYERDKQRTPAFLARADSIRGVVMGRNVFGELGITYSIDSAHRARLVARKKVAHRQFKTGDSIWVYREREPPYKTEVWPAGPDLRITLGRLAWFWLFGAVLLVGYGPLFKSERPGPDPSAA